MSKTDRVQVRVNPRLKDIGEKLATVWGLNSYQDLLRFWTIQAAKGNLKLETQKEYILTPEEEKSLEKMHKDYLISEKEGKVYKATSSKQLLKQLLDDEIEKDN